MSTCALLACALVVSTVLSGPASTAAPRTVSVRSAATAAAKAPQKKKHHGGARKGKIWKAYKGPFFNDPHVKADHFKIESKVIDTIDHARKGSFFRAAIYSFDRVPVANAIVKAFHRGVHVQMLLNDHQDTHAMDIVRNAVGHNRFAKSFIYECKESCRGRADEYNNLHSKFYLFTQAGKSQDVMAVGSDNMTMNADLHQWNDLYFLSGNEPLFKQYVGLFKDMKHDYSTRQPPMFFCGTPVNGKTCDDSVDKYTTWAFPRLSSSKNDLVLDMLNKIQCLTTEPDGTVQHTKLALAMHTMRGKRGDYLASAIRQKFADGCDFRVDYGLIGYTTKQILGATTARGRIPLRSTGLDYHPDDNYDLNHDGEDDLILDFYSHQKYFVIQGTYNGVPDTNMVLTGSSNWSSLSTANDEIWFTVHGKTVVNKYLKNFDFEWDSKVNSRDAYTTTYTDFRVARVEKQADGSTRTVYSTVRRPVTTIEKDPYKPGPGFERD